MLLIVRGKHVHKNVLAIEYIDRGFETSSIIIIIRVKLFRPPTRYTAKAVHRLRGTPPTQYILNNHMYFLEYYIPHTGLLRISHFE